MAYFFRGLVVGALLNVAALGAEEPKGNAKPAETALPVPAVAKPDAGMAKTVQELAALVKKSVVVVTHRGRGGQPQGLGAGFIVDSNGLIATNLHVIGEARPIVVELNDGRKFDVIAVEATERSHDLAVLRIDARDLPALPLGNSDELQEGQAIIAMGNPAGLEWSVVSGVLSGRREIEGRSMLQVALPIERGNSGGPVLDMHGRVHGLITLKSLKTENLGFAMPINGLKLLLARPNPVPMNRWLTIGALDPEDWTVVRGARWRQRAGRIAVSGVGLGFGGRSLCLSTALPPEGAFELAVSVKFEPVEGAAGLAFGADGGDKHYGFYPSNGNVRLTRFNGPEVTSWEVLREVRSPYLNKAGWNALKVHVEKGRILCYLNDELVIEEKIAEPSAGRIGLCKFRQTEAEFKGFRAGASIIHSKPSEDVANRVEKLVTGLKSRGDVSDAANTLIGDGSNAIELLEEHAIQLEQQAERVRKLASSLQLKQTLTEFEKVIGVKQGSIDLLRAGLLISLLDNPELEIEAYIGDVDKHAKRALADTPKEADEAARFAALNRYLFEEQGFHGSRTDYDNRSNSYLNEVLDDREGLPIALAVLYIEIAKRMELNVVGVGMPGHFLVRHEPKHGDSQLVDVFERGKLLSVAEARDKFESVSESAWNDRHLDTTPTRAILARMLQNLVSNAVDSADPERMFRYVEAQLVINPESERERFFRAALCHQTQRWVQAKADVKWLREHPGLLNQDAIDRLSDAIDRDSAK